MVTYSSATSKAQVTARMYFLADVKAEPLGPGSKEKKSALESLGRFLGMNLADQPRKTECGRLLAARLGTIWDEGCYSGGDTITLIGLNRLVDAAVEQIPGELRAQVVRQMVALPPAPKAVSTQEMLPLASLDPVEQNIAERVAELARSGETPQGVRESDETIRAEEVRFDDSGVWRAAVARVQEWLRLPTELDASSPTAFDQTLAEALGVDLGEHEADEENLRARLADRLERAVELRRQFDEDMESTAEGAATRSSATQRWIQAWDAVVDDEESEGGGPIRAVATTWPIVQFSQYAKNAELELSPSYQRADVWPTADAQMLIESILRGVPLPSVILLKRRGERGVVNYDVVDGKQRLTSILRFIGQHPGLWTWCVERRTTGRCRMRSTCSRRTTHASRPCGRSMRHKR